MRTVDITGQRFGRLVAQHRVEQKTTGWVWKFVCDCGGTYLGAVAHVKRGRATSCGCLRRETAALQGFKMFKHGLIDTPEYRAFFAMHSRCYNPSNASFHRYGGRGIKVCVRWHTLENFLSDMGKKPGAQFSIERINVNGDYEPSICKWATPKEQANNRTNSKRNTQNV
jgi:hypothetical protein